MSNRIFLLKYNKVNDWLIDEFSKTGISTVFIVIKVSSTFLNKKVIEL